MAGVDDFKQAALVEKDRIEAMAPRIGVEVVRVNEACKRAIEIRTTSDAHARTKAMAALRDAMGRLRALARDLGPVAKKLAPTTVATVEEALERGEARLAFLTAEHAEDRAAASQPRRGRTRR